MVSTCTSFAIRGRGRASGAPWRTFVIGLIAFLTLVDLFAAQAILPSLAQTYGVSPAAMGTAVNASTLGMAIAGLGVALISRRINRRQGIWVSLALLSIPTSLLAVAPDLATFSALRIAQGLCMASAFTLTMTYLGEHSCPEETAGALAAYITGNVASNLFGRLMSASVADFFGLAPNFYFFAALNLAGAALVYASLNRCTPAAAASAVSPLAAWAGHARNRPLRASFAIGFAILFAFIGTFTYVNFVLVDAPIGLSAMALGFVYLVFLPSIVTTPLAGRAARRFGARATFWGSVAIAGAGLPLLLWPSLVPVLTGLVLVGVGTFFAQAVATGLVSRAATADRASASGIYLACYFFGGMVGSTVLGQLFMQFGWAGCVAGIGAALAISAVLAVHLRPPATTGAGARLAPAASAIKQGAPVRG